MRNISGLYSLKENKTWQYLFSRQLPIVQNYACKEYLNGLEILALTSDKIPTLASVSKRLNQLSHWRLQSVAGILDEYHFFSLLAKREFPVVIFIREDHELDYIQEPDIFHELFGHCPMLTYEPFADFVHQFGKAYLKASPEDRIKLASIFFYTVEVGLIRENNALKIYGGGILSSKSESLFSMSSREVIHKPFSMNEVVKLNYQIETMQKCYFVIESFSELFAMFQSCRL